MMQINCGMLYQQRDLLQLLSVASDARTDWKQTAYRQFSEKIESPHFPCLFGRKAYSLQQCRILFVSGHSQIALHELITGFLSYTKFVRQTPMDKRLLYPMIVFLHFSPQTLKEQHQYAWDVLQKLHHFDPFGWPSAVESNPDDPTWSYYFAGVPLFVNISAPAHELMKSRNLGSYIVLVVNPRENFDVVANVNEVSGRKIRHRIRERVCAYNNGFMPRSLGFYGEEHNLEWTQYQLYEPGALNTSKCPIRIKTK